MLAAFECSWLSREEISTAARIAPATAKPAPTRNAWSKPLVSATAELWTPACNRLWVRLLAIVARIASPERPADLLGGVDQTGGQPRLVWPGPGDGGDRHGHECESEPEGGQQRRAEHVGGERAAAAGRLGEPEQAAGD